METNYLNLSLQRKKVKNVIDPIDYQIDSIREFAAKVWYVCDPCKYGKVWEEKIKYDSNNILQSVSAKEGRGEFRLGERFGEIKTSYLNKAEHYRVANIRDWQKYDLFLFNFIDDTFNVQFYLIPKEVLMFNFNMNNMDNLKDINKFNEYTNKATNIKIDQLSVLDTFNLLKGNTYEDLIGYIHYVGNNTVTPKKKETTTTVGRNPMTRVSLVVNGTQKITGKNNSEVMVNLIKNLGVKNCVGAIWNSQLSKVPTKLRNVELEDGYYLNPKFSIRDLKSNINNIRKKKGISIDIHKER
jgi:hypothetical protein